MKYFFLLAGAALMLWGIWTWRKELRNAASQGKPASDNGRRELEGLVEELVAVAEEVLGDAKTRAEELKDLVRQAESRIAELRAIAEAVPAYPARPDLLPRESALPELPASSGARGSAGSRSPSESDRYAEILALAAQGLEVTEIARVTNRTKGEIQLILGLKNLG